jgi:Fe2+ or Zn2+ uptake regulation protein
VSPDPDTIDRRLAERLRARGRRVTSQRVVLQRALHELGRHASAEEVLRATEDRLPGLSLPTVYATLELFEELGLVRRVAAGAGPVLYDPRTDGHAHFRCRACGAVTDLDARPDATAARRAARRAGHDPEAVEVVVGGLCAACRV